LREPPNSAFSILDRRWSSPAFLDHRRFPLLASTEDVVLRAADLALHLLGRLADEQPEFAAELMREKRGACAAALLRQPNRSPSSFGSPYQSER
jgi:hypothetical protein